MLTDTQPTEVTKESLTTSGYFYVVEATSTERTTFKIHKEGDEHRVGYVLAYQPRERSRWGFNEPTIEPAYVDFGGFSRTDPDSCRALGEVLFKAAALVEGWNSNIHEKLEEQRRKQEEARQRLAEERKREEEARLERERQANLQWAELYENMKWNIGERIKTKRTRMRSTITGTVDSVRPRGMSITTERNQPMDLNWSDLEFLDVRPDGQKKFERVYQGPTMEDLRSQRGW